MSVYRLQPLDAMLDHPAWEVSWHRASCHVVAETPQRARSYANGAFILPLKPAAPEAGLVELPWTSPRLVAVELVAGTLDFGLPGTVSIAPLPLLLTARSLQNAAAPGLPQGLPDALRGLAGLSPGQAVPSHIGH